MRLAWQYGRSLVFIAAMYLAMLVLAIWYLPQAMIRRERAFRAVHDFCRTVRWLAHNLVGLRSEIRGDVPQGAVLVAAKHQSFFDIIMIAGALPRPKFIMKAQLRFAPILGWFALRIGCVPVDRGKRAQAIRKMVEDVTSGRTEPGQLVIYPQGTRVAPGAARPYKVGTAVLYAETGQDCVPAACNVGVFWPRHGLLRKPGLAVVEFLPVIPAGLDQTSFMARLEDAVETRSNALMAEAGFPVAAVPPPAGKVPGPPV